MNNKLTDEEFLTRLCPGCTDDQLEWFIERVAIMVADGWSVITARAESWNELSRRGL